MYVKINEENFFFEGIQLAVLQFLKKMKYALKCHETIPTCHANSVIFQFEQTEITAMLCLMQNATENKILVLKIALKELERKEKYFKEFKYSWENPFVVNIYNV